MGEGPMEWGLVVGEIRCPQLWLHKYKWGFLSKEPDGGQWIESYLEETSVVKGILVRPAQNNSC